MNEEIKHYAKIIWDYHHMNHALTCADCILVLGSHDTRVAERGAELYLKGLAPFVIISGGLGKITKNLWKKTEAEKFAEIVCGMGVPKEKLLLETQSSNTGENIIFSRELVLSKSIAVNSLIAVNKPYMERRSYAAIRKLWPVKDVMVTSPIIEFGKYLDSYTEGEITRKEIISVMVGDLQRMKLYAEKGFQVYQHIPQSVWLAYDKMVELGFTSHLVK